MGHAEKLDATFESQVQAAFRALFIKAGMKPLIADTIRVTVSEPQEAALGGVSGALYPRGIAPKACDIAVVPQIAGILTSNDGYAEELASPLRLLQAHLDMRGLTFTAPVEGVGVGNLYLNAEGSDARTRMAVALNAALHAYGIYDQDITKLQHPLERVA